MKLETADKEASEELRELGHRCIDRCPRRHKSSEKGRTYGNPDRVGSTNEHLTSGTGDGALEVDAVAARDEDPDWTVAHDSAAGVEV